MAQTSTEIATGVYPGSQQGNAIRDLASAVSIIESAVQQVKSCVFLLNQLGTNDPEVTVLKNDFAEATPQFTRQSAGYYTWNHRSSFFPSASTVVIVGNEGTDPLAKVLCGLSSGTFEVFSFYDGIASDDGLLNTLIEIRVY